MCYQILQRYCKRLKYMYTIQNEKNSTNLLPKNSTTMINNLLYPAHNTKTFNSRIMFQFLENVIGTKKKR